MWAYFNRSRIGLTLLLCFVFLFSVNGQVNNLKLDPVKIKQFSPYLGARHGGTEGLENFKRNNFTEYQKEMWYFSESFYVKRDYFQAGISLDESIIDVSRFESQRQSDTESIIQLPGFKDALVLLPTKKLVFKPNY